MLKTVVAVVLSFASFFGVIIVLRINQLVSGSVALLMLVALIGLYFGFGVLLAVYRLIVKLDEAPRQPTVPAKRSDSADTRE